MLGRKDGIEDTEQKRIVEGNLLFVVNERKKDALFFSPVSDTLIVTENEGRKTGEGERTESNRPISRERGRRGGRGERGNSFPILL